MWLNICQGLVLFGWLFRLTMNVTYAARGREKVEASGALGIFITLVWMAFNAAIIWRSGALSTIVWTP